MENFYSTEGANDDVVNIPNYYTNEDDDSDDGEGGEKAGLSKIVVIGFDSEYVSEESNTATGKNQENTVLSLQFYLIAGDRHVEEIIYPIGSCQQNRPKFAATIMSLIEKAIYQGVLTEIPKRISLAGFFLRTDLVAFSDFNEFKFHLKNVGGKIGSDPHGVTFALKYGDVPSASDEPFADRLSAPKNTTIVTDKYNPRDSLIRIRFYDLGSHVAEGTNLALMGDLIGLPKLKIPDGFSIERMDKLLDGDQLSFELYAMRDAEITARYFMKLSAFAYQHTGNANLPATASSLGVILFEQSLKIAEIDFDRVFGLHKEKHVVWNKLTNKPVTKEVSVRDDLHLIHQPFVGMCYHGGRNETYHFGPTEPGIWNDFDLAAAYTTGLVDMKLIDYDHPRVTLDTNDFVGHVMGFALVEFAFPETTRYPCLPVEGHNGGLFYPLTGKSFCTAPEIEVALNLGCKITIKHGVIFPWRSDQGDIRPFEPSVRKVRELRKSYVKGSLDELYAKLLGNGMYGKTAQGIKPKNVFDTKHMQSEKLPCSRVSNALMAAHTTGLIRAVLGELIAGLPTHRRAVSATTDGFITDASMDEIDLRGPLATRYASLCERITSNRNILECKHRVNQLISCKTRGQFTCLAHEDGPVILAKAGISPPVSELDKNAYMVRLFMQRYPGRITQIKPFTSIRDQWSKSLDVTRTTRDKRMNLEYDHKRKLTAPKMEKVLFDGLVLDQQFAEHIRLDSKPWLTLDDAEQCRAEFDSWRRKNCLKNLADWTSWEDAYLFSQVKRKRAVPRNMGKGLNDNFKRMFVRAYTQEICGLSKTMTNKELADWLTSVGHETGLDDLKNAKRAKFFPNSVPRVDRTLEFGELLREKFPSIELDCFYDLDSA